MCRTSTNAAFCPTSLPPPLGTPPIPRGLGRDWKARAFKGRSILKRRRGGEGLRRRKSTALAHTNMGQSDGTDELPFCLFVLTGQQLPSFLSKHQNPVSSTADVLATTYLAVSIGIVLHTMIQ